MGFFGHIGKFITVLQTMIAIKIHVPVHIARLGEKKNILITFLIP